MTTESREREMVRKLQDTPEGGSPPAERPFTSLQPTYEDTVDPDPEADWEYE